ncbi:sulfotransferase family protein [Alloyangia pacifica]|uniref:sulfotransferase family protein n=1 Tax=Alloyangia pacifica TaxID=311180 RepID=UPI001CD1F757|nr:sulfotransferase [Alloyangia pacifica]MCA0995108.1 sulfotransferase [Alloyangia pacifica]
MKDIEILRHETLTEEQKSVMPNLFLIGAGKCGTTSLHAYLSQHPDITGSTEKEPSFFVENEELRERQLMESMRPEATDLDAYLGLFAHGPHAKYRMEASPSYSSYPVFSGIPERIAAASPDAHIIYMVRNPVDRAISHYWQDRKILKENRTALEALSDPENIYTYTSDYKRQLDRFRPYFDKIQIITSEDLRNRPQEVLSGIYARLDLKTFEIDESELRERNTTPPTTRQARHPLLTQIRDTKMWNHLRSRMPKSAVSAVRRVAVKDVPREIENEAELRELLAARFAPMMAAFDAEYGTGLHQRWFTGR